MRIIIGVTGASGVVLAEGLLKALKDHETHVVVSAGAEKLLEYELGKKKDSLQKLATHSYGENALESRIASSSYPIDAMVVVPCSMKTLAGMAHGYADNLITRAAENMLKFNRRLVVVPRETPLSLSALKNMAELKQGGAIILPPIVAFYPKPKTVQDINDFFIGKMLDALGIEQTLYPVWEGEG